MTEIRLCWSPAIRYEPLFKGHDDGQWVAATKETRDDFDLLTEAGNEVYGPGTHWVEEREV